MTRPPQVMVFHSHGVGQYVRIHELPLPGETVQALSWDNDRDGGKGSNVAASLIMGAVKCGMEVAVATPAEFGIKPKHIENAEQYGSILLTDDPALAAKNADIIYTDSYHYHSLITEEEAKILAPYKVTNRLMSAASGTAIFMHPLPAKRGVEVSADVIDGKQSIVYDQAENKLHAIKAILAR